MSHVVVSMNLLEAAVLMSEVAALPVGAVPLAVELAAVLRLVLVIDSLLLLVQVEWVVLGELLNSVRVLTF